MKFFEILSLNIFSKKMFFITILGILSGIPLVVIFSTLGAWFQDYSLSVTIIASIAVARLPYTLKFLWSPAIEHVKIPFLSNFFGMRKSWMILCTFINAILVLLMSFYTPSLNYDIIRLFAIFLGIFSSTFDVAFDSYRINILDEAEQQGGVSNAIFGYRIGALLSGAGILYFSDSLGWNLCFRILSIMIMIYIPIIMLSPFLKEQSNSTKINILDSNIIEKLISIYLIPIRDILMRDKGVTIILAIMSYKLGEVFLNMFTTPFLMEIGYPKTSIALIAKGFGLFATLSGVYFGSIVISYLGNYRGLLVCGIFQMLSNLSFVWIIYQEKSNFALTITIFTENFTGGMGTTAIVAFLSKICKKEFSATQYALLSAMVSFSNNFLSIYSGIVKESLGSWDIYFIFTVIISLPSLILLHNLDKYFSKKDSKIKS